MNTEDYFCKTQKRPPKTKPRAKPLPKAKEAYLEAEETLFQELEENLIGYRRKFQFESTKNWRFDFYIVRLNLLIEIAGSPWAVGRGGRKIANAFNKYNLAEEMGFRLERLEPHQIESGYAVKWIQRQLESLEDGTDQTIPTDRTD
jgi:very-short-patch-repair endonuclease